MRKGENGIPLGSEGGDRERASQNVKAVVEPTNPRCRSPSVSQKVRKKGVTFCRLVPTPNLEFGRKQHNSCGNWGDSTKVLKYNNLVEGYEHSFWLADYLIV